MEQLGQLWPELAIVGEAADGVQALRLLDEHRPDVMFLDIQMPGATGLEVARQASGRCHVVFVTAYDQHAVAVEAQAQGLAGELAVEGVGLLDGLGLEPHWGRRGQRIGRGGRVRLRRGRAPCAGHTGHCAGHGDGCLHVEAAANLRGPAVSHAAREGSCLSQVGAAESGAICQVQLESFARP